MSVRPQVLLAVLAAAVCWAAEPPPAASLSEEEPEPYRDVTLSPTLTGGLGLGLIGDHLVGELGARTLGLEVMYGRRWLLQWDGLVAFRGGVLANTIPYTSFLGGSSHGFAELGFRFQPQSPRSAYLGGRLAANLQVMAHPGVAMSELSTLNNSDGFGGVTLDGAGRVAGGVSLLDGERSLLLVGFLQEALVAPGLVTKGAAFTELGLGARFDLAERFSVCLEALVGSTPLVANPALELSNQTIRLQAGGELRKTFTSGVWLGLAASYTRDSHRLVYTVPSGAVTYGSANPGTIAITLSFGVILWRKS